MCHKSAPEIFHQKERKEKEKLFHRRVSIFDDSREERKLFAHIRQ